jgi:hypothetical protein
MAQLTTQSTFSLAPNNLQEAMQYAEIMSKSTIVPKNYQGKTGDILVAVQMGAELGLKPIQALQNIAVINGKPSVYGDGLLALVQAHHSFEDIQESFEDESNTAICTVKRKNQSSYTVKYTKEDAEKAGLWGKIGPWKQYPKRMLQMRARGFALRDKFADVLGGLIITEEAKDYPVDVTPQAQPKDLSSKLDNVLLKQTQSHLSPILKEAGELEVEEQEEATSTQPELSQLILTHNVAQDITDSWCKKAGVDSIYDLKDKLTADQVIACKDYIDRNCVENVKEIA